MRHTNHCLHCGTAMPGNVCPGCRTEITTMPIWPLSRCQSCGTRVIKAMWADRSLRTELLLMMWPITIGTIFILIGLLIPYGSVQGIGLILVIGWLLSRLCYQLIRKSEIKLIDREADRWAIEVCFLANPAPNCEEREQMDEANDKVRSTGYVIQGMHHLRTVVRLIMAVAISFIITSWGPGDPFPWKAQDWVKNQYHDITQAPITESTVQDIRNNLEWDSHQVTFLRNELRNHRNLTEDEYKDLRKNNFNATLLIDELQRVSYKKTELFDHLKKLQKASATAPKTQYPLPVVKKDWSQKFHEALWLTCACANLILLIGLIGYFVAGAISFIGYLVFEIGDELKDQIKLQLDKRRENTVAIANAPAGGGAAAVVGEIGKEVSSHLFLVSLVSVLADFLFDKVFHRSKTA